MFLRYNFELLVCIKKIFQKRDPIKRKICKIYCFIRSFVVLYILIEYFKFL